ncbi:Ni/Fe-hydrogenase, b-type cytochrome subunit [Paludibaculum fermentans]|uniref:Ni/Fe-hydrogenase, b-type cytochrome subunit n=1 Tax=Paludibaculum fermentans TaxID=1473598 RepID=A0A7S7SK93_PALFE|nr:Ni/Fe-hydrogenase, b-type cytochrome subunit [Paludibaculum fermentans]QOY88912.1 Ni/Fe-hydrogenase, b-type cytochrome subunit [Paludibaculum fermentans]
MATAYERLDLSPGEAKFGMRYVWEFPVRLSHWVNVAAIPILFATGLYIGAPQLAPNGEAWQHFVMGRVRQIHFVAAYALLFSFLLRVFWFWVGNNYARSGFPFVWRKAWWGDLAAQTLQYLKLDRGHVHLGHNALAGASYTFFVIFLGWFQILTGLALYSETNPGGFWSRLTGWVFPLLGGSYGVRLWHHTTAWGFVVFVILHIYIVLYDNAQFRNGLISSIISGFKFYEKGDLDHDKWLT